MLAAAVVVLVVAEALPVLAVVDLAHQVVLELAQVVARLVHRLQLPLRVRLLAKAPLRVLVPLVLAGLPVLVVEPVGPLQHRLSRQSSSAARARSSL